MNDCRTCAELGWIKERLYYSQKESQVRGECLTGERKEVNRLTAELAEAREEISTLKRVYNQLFDACKSEQSRAEKAEKELSRYRDALLYIYRGDGRINPTVADLMYIARETLEGATILEG